MRFCVHPGRRVETGLKVGTVWIWTVGEIRRKGPLMPAGCKISVMGEAAWIANGLGAHSLELEFWRSFLAMGVCRRTVPPATAKIEDISVGGRARNDP